ncbi:MAG: hypothetical protein RL076_1548 [Chloroflexota bacterium]|jgi:S1-C subfamily serine protease
MKITRALLVLMTLMLLISCSVPQVTVSTGEDTKKPALDAGGTAANDTSDAPGGGAFKPSADTSNDNDLVKPTAETVEKKSTSTLESVMAATVQLGVLDAQWNQVGACTGSIIDPRGLIITNFHCIGDNETGQFYNADGIDYVYMTLDPRDPPKLQFIAQTVDADASKDIAVMRIIATTNGEPPADCLNLPAITLNMDEEVNIGTKVTSVGYPGVGGDTLTIANGQVVGFDEYSMSGQGRTYEAIKYDASDSAGISGGPIINENFEQIAIAHAGRSDNEKGGELSLARPIALADDLINSSKLVRIPGCNGADAAQLIGPAATTSGTQESSGGTTTETEVQEFSISGRVLDSVSSEPIANCYIVILKPEYDWADVNYDAIDDYIWTFAQTDSNGVYTLTVTETMASDLVSYGMFAKGYDTWTGDDVNLLSIYDKDKDEWVDLYLDAEVQ